jgi:hypothetical protein
VLGVVVTAAAVAAAAAGAPAPGKEKIDLTSAGQAAARAAVLKRADLGSSGAWTGGVVKPNLSSQFPCPSFQPKQSDLTLIGAAETVWKGTGLEFNSEAQVLQTPEMVRLDWQRTVLAPQVLPCLRAGLAKQFSGASRLVSFNQIAFARIATYTQAYRAVVEFKNTTATVPVMVDVVLVGRSRTELTLTTSAPLAEKSAISAAELRLARLLVSRIRA